MVNNSSSSLRWTLRGAEWTLLLMLTLLYALDIYFKNAPYVFESLLKVFAFNLAFFLLSFIFPIAAPVWQRRTYIALEILLVILATALGIEYSVILYLFLVKSCFLLSRREVLLTVLAAGTGYMLGNAWQIPQFFERDIKLYIELLNSRNLNEIYGITILGVFIQYLGISIFVILLGFAIAAERKSRQRAEILAKEVEYLAANLERTRIAREIHDSFGHTLTTLGVQLEVALKLRQRNPEQALQALDTAKLLTDQCLEDVRLALKTIRQSDFNFNQALVALLEQMKQHQSLTIVTEVDLPSLPLPTSQQLYRIVQEGLTNIQKHAFASRVHLRAWTSADTICLTLSDDGHGFNPELSYPGFGLENMKERVQILGGELHIVSAPSQGTHIQVRIPQFK